MNLRKPRWRWPRIYTCIRSSSFSCMGWRLNGLSLQERQSILFSWLGLSHWLICNLRKGNQTYAVIHVFASRKCSAYLVANGPSPQVRGPLLHIFSCHKISGRTLHTRSYPLVSPNFITFSYNHRLRGLLAGWGRIKNPFHSPNCSSWKKKNSIWGELNRTSSLISYNIRVFIFLK